MIQKYTAAIVCDASGDAEVYLGANVTGKILALKYLPGTIATGGDLTITGETSGVPILTKADAGTSNAWFYPRVLPNKVSDGSAFTDLAEFVWVYEERIKVAVAQGGNGGAGSIEVLVDEAK